MATSSSHPESAAEFLTTTSLHRALAEVGHELRNPLSAMAYALEVWPSVVGNPELMGELHHLMLRQVQQLVRLSEDLLEVARITEGKFRMRFARCDLKEILGDACEQLRPVLERSGHRMRMEMPESAVLLIADSLRLVQVFSNLIQNAIKFSPGSGDLRMALVVTSDIAIVSVRDEGVGIDSQRLQTIFEPLVQGGGILPQDGMGLGLGLALVRAIVEKHGGGVIAESSGVGHGSQFIVRLPLLDRERRSGRGQSDESLSSREQTA